MESILAILQTKKDLNTMGTYELLRYSGLIKRLETVYCSLD